MVLRRKIFSEVVQNLEFSNVKKILKTVCVLFQIDSSVIKLMSDGDLSKYIPHFGDRLAVIAFCRRGEGSSRSHLLDKIKAKIASSKGEKRVQTAQSKIGNVNAKKQKRKLEIGWMNFSEIDKQYKQVRAPKGGGTRYLCIDRQTSVREIQKIAESLFFPDGRSRSLKLE